MACSTVVHSTLGDRLRSARRDDLQPERTARHWASPGTAGISLLCNRYCRILWWVDLVLWFAATRGMATQSDAPARTLGRDFDCDISRLLRRSDLSRLHDDRAERIRAPGVDGDDSFIIVICFLPWPPACSLHGWGLHHLDDLGGDLPKDISPLVYDLYSRPLGRNSAAGSLGLWRTLRHIKDSSWLCLDLH